MPGRATIMVAEEGVHIKGDRRCMWANNCESAIIVVTSPSFFTFKYLYFVHTSSKYGEKYVSGRLKIVGALLHEGKACFMHMHCGW